MGVRMTDRDYCIFDWLRLAAAFLVVAIHTSPFYSVNAGLDFMVVHVAARVAVPYFLMLSGFFLLPGAAEGKTGPVIRFLRRTGLLYLSAVLLYLPVNLYAGQLSGWNILKKLLFDGTFYHLWYLPASLLGMTIVCLAVRRYSLKQCLLPAVILYGIGLLGDSYYGLTEQVPVLCKLYSGLFAVSSYTRNGIFYAPLFLVLGGLARQNGTEKKNGPAGQNEAEKQNGPAAQSKAAGPKGPAGWTAGAAAVLCFMVLLAEGEAVHRLSLSRHDSMYLSLPFVMWFFFSFLLRRSRIDRRQRVSLGKCGGLKEEHFQRLNDKRSGSGKGCPFLRTVSAEVYVIHPLVIIGIRKAAGITGTKTLFVDNSVIHYLAVCLFSFLAACIAARFGKAGQNRKRRRRRRAKNRKKNRAWIELDREALKTNVRLLTEKLPDGCKLMPAVKADAYGHGAVWTARELNRLGIRSFCVAEIEEGIKLRKKHIRGEILILGYTHPSQISRLKRYRLTQTVVDCDYAGQLDRGCRHGYFSSGLFCSGLFCSGLKVQVKIDTGMHRLGEWASHADRIAAIWNCGRLKITGVYTHLCAADSKEREDVEFTGSQVRRFDGLREALEKRGIPVPPLHVQNSFGMLNENIAADFVRQEKGEQRAKYDYVRPGIALYGLMSRKKDAELCKLMKPLAPVLSLYARIAAVKEIKKGESAGYGRAYRAACDGRIAVLSIGYADGIPRSLKSGAAYVLIGGKRAPVVGRICMDQMLVDVSGIREAVQGGVAVLIGEAAAPDGKEERIATRERIAAKERITAEDMAEWAGTISNELVSRLGSRLPRLAAGDAAYG